MNEKINKPETSSKKGFLDFIINIAIIIGLAAFIRLFIVEPYNIEGTSMCDTLNCLQVGENDKLACTDHGERILLNKTAYRFIGIDTSDPKRGDIIVFMPPQGKKEPYIKRIIGLPGETIEIKNGKVIIANKNQPEGQPLVEKYLNSSNQGKTFPIGGVTKFVVPENKYFVLGDNRNASSDSRSCFHLRSTCLPGDDRFVTVDAMKGKAWVTIWPFYKMRQLEG